MKANSSAALQHACRALLKNCGYLAWKHSYGHGHLGPTGTRAGFEKMNNSKWVEGEEALKGAEGRAKLLLLAATDKERWWRKAKRKSM